MSRLLLTITIYAFLNQALLAQSGFPKYYQLIDTWQKADSLYQLNQYNEAAVLYEKAAFMPIEKGIELSRTAILYNAAAMYALAEDKEKSFDCLEKLVTEMKFRAVEQIQNDTDFTFLIQSTEWATLLMKIKANQTAYEQQQAIYTERTQSKQPINDIVFYPLQSGFIADIFKQDTLPFLSIAHQHYLVYFSANSYAAQHLPDIKEELTQAYFRAINILQIPSYKRGIRLILFNSVEEMKALSGIRAQGGVAYANYDTGLFPIHEKRRPQFKHEIFHIISQNTWGDCPSRLLLEGSAVYADNQCFYDNPIYTINAYLVKNAKALRFDDLIHHFDEKAIQNDVITYLQSAGIFKYLYEKYGIEKMKRLWTQGFTQFEAIYGISTAEFEQEWLKYISTISIPSEFDFEKLNQGCG